MGINREKIEEEEKNIAQFVEKDIESHLDENQKEKIANIEQGIEKAIENVEKKLSTSSDSGTKTQKQIENQKENTSLDEKKEEPTRKSIKSELNTEPDKTNILLDDNQSTDSDVNEQKSIGSKRKFSLKSLTTGLLESSRKNSKNKISKDEVKDEVKDEIQIDPSNLFQFVNPAVVSKTNEAKQTFLNGGKEDEGNKVQKDESNVERDGDDTVEFIEEVVYIDGADGEDGEEIIEEIIETTTTQESPDSFDSQSGEQAPTVTVTKTTRKISSSSKPGEVVTTEETVVSDNLENEGKKRKKSFGLKLGIGKSGVNASVGEKQMSVGLSGMKFGKKSDKSNGPDLISVGLDKSGLTLDRDLQPETLSDASSVSGRSTESSPKKSKKIKAGIPNFNLFKRSTSVPAGSDLPEVLDKNPQSTATLPRKTSQGSAGLLVFGKSRSKSTGLLEADDMTEIVTDLNVLSDFIDQEREANLQQLNSSSVGSDKISPVQTPEQNSAEAGTSAIKDSKVKIGDQPKSTKIVKNKSANEEKKSTKKSKK